MKLKENIMDINSFEKKTVNIDQFKEKLLSYKKVNEKFMYWSYTQENDELHDDKSNYFIMLIMTAIPSLVFELEMIDKGLGFLSIPILILSNLTVMSLFRNLKFGILRRRYKRWQLLRKDIKTIMNDKNNVFSLLFETELKLKDFQKIIDGNAELTQTLNDSIVNTIQEIKTIFSNYDNNPDNIFILIEKLEDVKKYEELIVQTIKSSELHSEYLEYKKANGLIESNEEESLEDKKITNFKAIL